MVSVYSALPMHFYYFESIFEKYYSPALTSVELMADPMEGGARSPPLCGARSSHRFLTRGATQRDALMSDAAALASSLPFESDLSSLRRGMYARRVTLATSRRVIYHFMFGTCTGFLALMVMGAFSLIAAGALFLFLADRDPSITNSTRAQPWLVRWARGLQSSSGVSRAPCAFTPALRAPASFRLRMTAVFPAAPPLPQWESYTYFVDPGTQTGLLLEVDGSASVVTAVVVSLIGFTWVLVVFGFIVERMGTIMEDWRRQHQRILAHGHTLVLGWTGKTLFLLSELAQMLTDGPHRGGTIVILGELDTHDMREEVQTAYSDFRQRWPRVQLHFWTGKPYEVDDLGTPPRTRPRRRFAPAPRPCQRRFVWHGLHGAVWSAWYV